MSVEVVVKNVGSNNVNCDRISIKSNGCDARVIVDGIENEFIFDRYIKEDTKINDMHTEILYTKLQNIKKGKCVSVLMHGISNENIKLIMGNVRNNHDNLLMICCQNIFTILEELAAETYENYSLLFSMVHINYRNIICNCLNQNCAMLHNTKKRVGDTKISDYYVSINNYAALSNVLLNQRKCKHEKESNHYVYSFKILKNNQEYSKINFIHVASFKANLINNPNIYNIRKFIQQTLQSIITLFNNISNGEHVPVYRGSKLIEIANETLNPKKSDIIILLTINQRSSKNFKNNVKALRFGKQIYQLFEKRKNCEENIYSDKFTLSDNIPDRCQPIYSDGISSTIDLLIKIKDMVSNPSKLLLLTEQENDELKAEIDKSMQSLSLMCTNDPDTVTKETETPSNHSKQHITTGELEKTFNFRKYIDNIFM